MESCPFCAERLAPGATKCAYCGESLVHKGVCPRHREEDLTACCQRCGGPTCPRCMDGPGAATCRACAGGGPEDARKEYDLGRVLGWPSRDPEWIQKVLVGAACMLGGFLLLPILAFMGYKMRVARQQWQRPGELPMPSWQGFFELVGDGLKVWVALFLPMFLLMAVFGACLAAGVFAVVASAPPGGGGPPSDAMAVGGVLGMVVLWGGLFLGLLAFQYLKPAIEMEYLETGSLTSGIHVGSIWRRVTSDPVEYLILFLYHYLVGLIASLGMFACFVGIYFTAPWALCCDGALLGRYLAKRDQARADA